MIRNSTKIICQKCNKEYNKYQPLKFSAILSVPYIQCPYCSTKKYLNLDERRL